MSTGQLKALHDANQSVTPVPPSLQMLNHHYLFRKVRSTIKWKISEQIRANNKTQNELSTRLKPTTPVLQPHLLAKVPFYQTAEFPDLDNMVRFFREACPSRNLTVHIVEKHFPNIPAKVLPKLVPTFFLSCCASIKLQLLFVK